MSKIVLSDGGAYHRPEHPHVFASGLRAAAHYLKAVEQVDPAVRKELTDKVLGEHPFPRHFPEWQGVGLFPSRVTHKPVLGRPTQPQRERFEEARPFFRALRLWANQYYMWSPYLLNLLYKILDLRDKVNRKAGQLDSGIRSADGIPLTDDDRRYLEIEQARLEFLKGEQQGWGWWVDFLASGIRVLELHDWIRNKSVSKKSHREIFERMDCLRIQITWEGAVEADMFSMHCPGWRPEEETWSDFEARLRQSCEAALQNYRSVMDARLEDGHLSLPRKKTKHAKWGKPHTWEAVPKKYAGGGDHFKWLALRQVKGVRPQQIVDRHDVSAKISAVNEALGKTAALLELDLRPVKSGPTPHLDSL